MAIEISRAATYLTYVGNTIFTLGTATGAVGVLYAVHRISGHGISGLEAIPGFIHSLTGPEGQAVETSTPQGASVRQTIIREGKAYCVISGLIGAGAALVLGGKKMVDPATLQWVNQLYR